jgi:glyoxylase-like metal-dependent hydrolase (beta-lactamase superfamily II)
VSDELQQIAERVWLFARDPDNNKIQPNVGVICTPTQTILIDGGNSPRHARRILTTLAQMSAPPVSYVIYTHHHWDHVFGASVFGATAIAHEQCRKLLIEAAGKPWSYTYLQEEMRRTPLRESALIALGRAIDDWRSFRILLPAITFMHKLRLYLDGFTLDLEHVGGRHAADSVVVRVLEAGVLFTGDCYYPEPIHLREDNDDTLDGQMIEALADDAIHIYVDGHGDPRSRAEFLSIATPGNGA